MYQSLFAKLQPEDTIITVNQRLSAYLRERYNVYQQQLGVPVWQTPDILPLTTWLERCWLECQIKTTVPPLILLKPAHELMLWQQIIAQSPAGENILNVFATAQMAKSAWELCIQWQIDINTFQFQQTEDTCTWKKWADTFQHLCVKNNWLDNPSLMNHIAETIKSNLINLPKHIYLIGFDELNPQQKYLFSTLQKCNCSFQHIHTSDSRARPIVASFPDTEIELTTMTRWAYDLWKKNPEAHIGCVVPNLTNIRMQIVNIFSSIFTPENILPGYHLTPTPFNISSGNNLSEFPLVETALRILKLTDKISFENLTALLHSPYLGFAEKEMLARAELDITLRNHGDDVFLLQQIITAAKKTHCPKLAVQLQTHLKNQTQINTPKTPTQWLSYFKQQLDALGWPGERTLDSMEFQQCERWLNLLNEFASFDFIHHEISLQQALQLLGNLIATIVFQPKSTGSTIQVLGLLEAAGIEFDYLWIMDLHDDVWPPAANPNPFIPKSIQRQLNIPHATQQRELQYCKTITERLCQSATQVYLSYPEFEEDRKLHPSPLIKLIPTTPGNITLTAYKNYLEYIQDSASIEFFTDEKGIPVNMLENIHGGVNIFKQQAACPFRAYANFRLKTKSLGTPDIGLNTLERGSLLHLVLEFFWRKVIDQKNLLALTTDALNNVIDQVIDEALAIFKKDRPFTFKTQFTQIEKIRLRSILTKWLEREKKRPAFSVLATEQEQKYTIANMDLHLRIDRIDQLADGNYMLIDYKTGETSVAAWFGQRPDEPQLPLYYISHQHSVSGLLFAEINAKSAELKGISAEGDEIKGITTQIRLKNPEVPNHWGELKNYWHVTLEKLGDEFRKGYAKVDPKKGNNTCQHCDLQILCRRFEMK